MGGSSGVGGNGGAAGGGGQDECVFGASGPGILEGDVILGQTHAIADLADISCVAGSLEIADMALGDLSGPETLTHVADSLHIAQNASLGSPTGLENLEVVGGDFTVEQNPVLTTLAHQ